MGSILSPARRVFDPAREYTGVNNVNGVNTLRQVLTERLFRQIRREDPRSLLLVSLLCNITCKSDKNINQISEGLNARNSYVLLRLLDFYLYSHFASSSV